MTMSQDANERRAPRALAAVWDALVDLNPVLARELVVTLRAPVYLGSLVVTTLLLTIVVVLATVGGASTRSVTAQLLPGVSGAEVLPYFFAGLTAVIATFGSALGSTVLVREHEGATLDALKFSSLRPRTIAVGAFSAVMLAELAVAVCGLPLLAFVLALGGVSLGEAAVSLAVSLTTGAMAAAIGIGVSAHAPNARRALLFSLLGAAAVGMGVMSWLALAAEVAPHETPFVVARAYFVPWTSKHVAALAAVPAFGVSSVLGLGYAAATSGLMDATRDRTLPIKRWMWTLLPTGGALLAVSAEALPMTAARNDVVILWMIITGALAIVLLFVSAGDPVSLTRRLRAHPRPLLGSLLCPRRLAPSILVTVVWSGLAVGLGSALLLPSQLPYAGWLVAQLAAIGGLTGAVAASFGPARGRFVGTLALTPVVLVPLLRAQDHVTWVDALCPLWLPSGLSDETVLVRSISLWGTVAVGSLAVMMALSHRRRSRP